MMSDSFVPPFINCTAVTVLLPTHVAHLSEADQQSLANMPHIFAESSGALARELGAPLTFSSSDPGVGPRWLIGPASCHPALATIRPAAVEPELFLDREQQLLITDAPSVNEVWGTFSWLRSLGRFQGGTWRVADCPDIDTAIERIAAEVGDSYPSFALRNLDWASLCERYRPYVREASDPIYACQEWLAQLNDTHTWVRPLPPLGELPYEVWLTAESAILTAVPWESAAWEAGVRAGFRLVGHDVAAVWQRTAATPHARPLVAGRRLMSGVIGTQTEWTAVSPQGEQIHWSEPIPATRYQSIVRWRKLSSKTGYLKINSWQNSTEDELDVALSELRQAERLIVDLRGNGGGSLAVAQRFRDRFLRQKTHLGSIRYSIEHKVLSEPELLYAEPAAPQKRWAGQVRFLTDPLTYSASEDALLGLQGLDHVQIIGEPSGGGSGRIRVLRLLPGWWLTISTALTYDRQGYCVENAGILVDRPVVPERFRENDVDVVLHLADQDW